MTSPTRDNPFDGGSLHGQRVRFTEPDERFARSIDEDMKRRDILAEITGVCSFIQTTTRYLCALVLRTMLVQLSHVHAAVF